MESRYEKYIEEGTKKLMEIGASSDVSKEERQFIVDVFTEELVNKIDNVSDDDYEYILYSASAKYIDTKLTEGMSNADLSYEECEDLIKLCRRQRELSNLFNQKKWAFRDVNIKSDQLDRCEDFFSKTQESILISNRIRQEDKEVSRGIEIARKDLSISNCEKARVLIQKLANSITECELKGFVLPEIQNKDIQKAFQEIDELRNLAEQRDTLHKDIIQNDLCIKELLLEQENTEQDDLQKWNEITQLCDEQQQLIDDCNTNGWELPEIEYDNPEYISSRFSLYIKMKRLDDEMLSLREQLNSKSQYENFYSKCESQERDIEKCRKERWRIPNLVIDEPRKLAEKIRRKKRKSDVLRGLFITATVMVIVIASLLVGFYLYTKDRVQIPVDNVEALEGNIDDIYKQFEEAGFENIVKKEDKSGWLPDKQIRTITVGDTNVFKKGTWLYPTESVVITYSSEGRIDAGKLLKNWENLDYRAIEKKLRDAGFTKINCSEKNTYEKELNQKTTVVLNGDKYSEGACYLPKDAPIVITHHILKIKIGSSAYGFEGKNYRSVINELEDKGFTNITWWGNNELIFAIFHDEGEIKTFTINGSSDFSSEDEFLYDVPIEIDVYTK